MSKKDNELTPMMKQFFSFKAQHPDAMLLFRCGDFYETYLRWRASPTTRSTRTCQSS